MMDKVVKSSELVLRVSSPFSLSEKDITGAKLPKETPKNGIVGNYVIGYSVEALEQLGKRQPLFKGVFFHMRCRVDINLSLFYGDSLTVRMDFRICI